METDRLSADQLFDLRADPEKKDLMAAPARAGDIERLTRLVRERHENVGDKQPLSVGNARPKDISFHGQVRKINQ